MVWAGLSSGSIAARDDALLVYYTRTRAPTTAAGRKLLGCGRGSSSCACEYCGNGYPTNEMEMDFGVAAYSQKTYPNCANNFGEIEITMSQEPRNNRPKKPRKDRCVAQSTSHL